MGESQWSPGFNPFDIFGSTVRNIFLLVFKDVMMQNCCGFSLPVEFLIAFHPYVIMRNQNMPILNNIGLVAHSNHKKVIYIHSFQLLTVSLSLIRSLPRLPIGLTGVQDPFVCWEASNNQSNSVYCLVCKFLVYGLCIAQVC